MNLTVLTLMIGIMMIMLKMIRLDKVTMLASAMLRMSICRDKKRTRDGFTDRSNLILLR